MRVGDPKCCLLHFDVVSERAPTHTIELCEVHAGDVYGYATRATKIHSQFFFRPAYLTYGQKALFV